MIQSSLATSQISETVPIGGEQGETEERVGYSTLVGVRFTKPGYLYRRIVLDGLRLSKISTPSHLHLKSLCRGLNCVQSCTQSRRPQHHISISRLYLWGSFWEQGWQVEHTGQAPGRRQGPPTAQLTVPLMSHFLGGSLQQLIK